MPRLKNAFIQYRQIEISHILENIVYLELLRRDYIVDIGKCTGTAVAFAKNNEAYLLKRIVQVQIVMDMFGLQAVQTRTFDPGVIYTSREGKDEPE